MQFKNFATNWKTTSGGILMIAGGVYLYIHDNTKFMEGLTAVLGGIGLLFAKDGNVTGGSTPQDSTPKDSSTIKP